MTLLFIACQDKVQPLDSQSVVVRNGTSFGFCVGNCWRQLEVNATTFTFQVGNHGKDSITRTCSDKQTTADWNKLLATINWDTFKKLPDVTGCPDCADGGAEWIEIQKDTETKRITFEYGKDFPEVADLLKLLREKRKAYEKSCQ